MLNTMMQSFPASVSEKLMTYVYRLIDPRNDETFYIGKGQGNRVFDHIKNAAAWGDDDVVNRIQKIREIHQAGLQVKHVIHRHGMDENTALEVEAALIDFCPNLTNNVGGMGSSEFGPMSADEITRKYAAEPATFQHKALLICINLTGPRTSYYEATQYAWKISKQKAEQAEVILATERGVIVAAFVADRWLAATAENFPGQHDLPGRWGFVGHEAPESVWRLYVGKRVPDEYRARGAANPVRYTWR
jgi:uncharacterized protein